MKNVAKLQRGFTIVELLIVIVVIGILAAITITTFTGIQKRAQDARTLALVNDWEKIFGAYAAVHGEYPYVTRLDNGTSISNGIFCLGILPSTENFPEGECTWDSGNRNSSYINRQLSDNDFNIPNSRLKTVPFGSRSIEGISVRTNSSRKNSYLIYYPLIQEKCSAGDGVGYQVLSDGVTIAGASAPGTYGRSKSCIRTLPDL